MHKFRANPTALPTDVLCVQHGEPPHARISTHDLVVSNDAVLVDGVSYGGAATVEELVAALSDRSICAFGDWEIPLTRPVPSAKIADDVDGAKISVVERKRREEALVLDRFQRERQRLQQKQDRERREREEEEARQLLARQEVESKQRAEEEAREAAEAAERAAKHAQRRSSKQALLARYGVADAPGPARTPIASPSRPGRRQQESFNGFDNSAGGSTSLPRRQLESFKGFGDAEDTTPRPKSYGGRETFEGFGDGGDGAAAAAAAASDVAATANAGDDGGNDGASSAVPKQHIVAAASRAAAPAPPGPLPPKPKTKKIAKHGALSPPASALSPTKDEKKSWFNTFRRRAQDKVIEVCGSIAPRCTVLKRSLCAAFVFRLFMHVGLPVTVLSPSYSRF